MKAWNLRKTGYWCRWQCRCLQAQELLQRRSPSPPALQNWLEILLLLVAVLVVAVTTLIVLSSADWVSLKIGRRGQRIFLRFMGLILAAVGAQILLSGLHSFTPGP